VFRPQGTAALFAAGLLGASLALPTVAGAQQYSPYPVRNWPAPVQAPYRDYPYQAQTPYAPQTWEEAQALQQRCSVGRLVGGVVGGGLGYAASRQDGRAWAVPLGALLGSQIGCNAGLGRGPLPW
jgi:hypothetical protein